MLALLFVVLVAGALARAGDEPASLVNVLTVAGDARDRLAESRVPWAGTRRLGGFGSDLFYDRAHDVYYGLADRGPGGGVMPYATRVQKFSLAVDPVTGAISRFTLLSTIAFTDHGEPFSGLNASILNDDSSMLGRSFDPEGLVVAPNGRLFVSDEYGPSVDEFRPDGTFVRAFEIPERLRPRAKTGALDFVGGRPAIVSGRQDNRGFEGLAISPDGARVYAMMQDPLVEEGDGGDGRVSRNLRIVGFDIATGRSAAQYIYQLDALADLNRNLPADQAFPPTAQGRNIGISALTAIDNHEFLVVERDNRGVSTDDPTGRARVASKRIYRIDLDGATDVGQMTLEGTSELGRVRPVTKTLFLDVAAALDARGLAIAEKIEGLAIGPRLRDGRMSLVLASDNDFSVTQVAGGAGDQRDVCTDGRAVAEVPVGAGCAAGLSLIPTYLYALAADLAGYRASGRAR